MFRTFLAACLSAAALLAPVHSAHAGLFSFLQEEAPQVSQTLVVKVGLPECGADYQKIGSYLGKLEGIKSVWTSDSKRYFVMEIDPSVAVNMTAVDLVISRSGLPIEESKFSHENLAHWKYMTTPVAPL